MSKYDPRPYTVIEIVGRQAVLERDGSKIKRETQKFKRFYSQPNQHDQQSKDDDWEDGNQGSVARSARSAEGHQEGLQATATVADEVMTGSQPQPNNDNILTVPDTQRMTDSQQTTVTDQTTATVAPRRTPRAHVPPDRYGSWVAR